MEWNIRVSARPTSIVIAALDATKTENMLINPIRKECLNYLASNIKSTSYLGCIGSSVREPYTQQTRNTYILKRRNPPPLVRYEKDKKDFIPRRRRTIYDLVENTNHLKMTPLKLLLIKPVQGLGLPGDLVEVGPNKGREKLLLPGLAVYASEENLEKYKDVAKNQTFDIPSSKFVHRTIEKLESSVFSVCMNMEEPWEIEPWHVRVAFRRRGVMVPESAISIPPSPIKGPDMNLERKEFLVRVKINDKEEAKCRFRVHHVATEPMNRLPWLKNHWYIKSKPVFPEEAPILDELNAKDSNMIEELSYEH